MTHWNSDSALGTASGLRVAVGILLLGAVAGAAMGIVKGLQIVRSNLYAEQLPRLARWVLIDSVSTGMLQAAAAVLAALVVVLLIWPIGRLAFGSWTRGLHAAVLAVPVGGTYLTVVWWVNRHLLPGAFSAASIAGNVVLAAIAASVWFGVGHSRKTESARRLLVPFSTLARPLPLAVLLAVVLSVQVARPLLRLRATTDSPDVVLIVIDALRADRLGTYGYRRDTSPNLDRLARDGWQFQNAFSAAPWTKPSIASVLTGLYPRAHGVESAGWNVNADGGAALVAALPQRLLTLPELLADAGYRTAGLGQNHHLVAKLGFNQGFDLYNLELADRGTLATLARKLRVGVLRKDARQAREQNSAAKINARFLRWLPSDHERFFAYLHHVDVHWPYRARPDYAGHFGPRRTSVDFNSQEFYAEYGPERAASGTPSAIDPAVLKDMADAYDEGIRHVDAELGKLFAELKHRGRYDHTLIIVTADHGEQFMEHGEIGHGTSLHDVLLRVPLIVKFPCPGPHCGARRVDEPVQLTDLMPTVLEAVGIQVPPASAGRSLTGAAQPERVLFAEKGEQVALRTRQFKFIYNLDGSGAELYALESDPDEKVNIAATEPALTQTLRDRLFQWIEETDSRAAAPREQVPADDAMLEKLKSLGYLK